MNEFEFRPDRTTDYGISCPWAYPHRLIMGKMMFPLFLCCFWLDPFEFQKVIMGKWCLHASLFLGNKDMFKNYMRFDFWHVQTADIGGTKPWKNNCSLIWKLFKFLMTLLAGLFEMRGCWHIGLRWAIVALWATCSLPQNTGVMKLLDY